MHLNVTVYNNENKNNKHDNNNNEYEKQRKKNENIDSTQSKIPASLSPPPSSTAGRN